MSRSFFRCVVGTLWLVSLCLAAVGCGEPTLDQSDLNGSIERVRESVEESRRGDFDTALGLVREASTGKIEGTDPFSLDGMTASAIFAEAKKIGLRRDLAWAERDVGIERQVVDARDRLALLAIHGLQTNLDEGETVRATFEVENGLETPLDTAWIWIEATRAGGDPLGGEDMVDFRPALKPGERRRIQIIVSSDARRALPPESGQHVSARFTLAEHGHEVVAQEPTPENLAEAKRRLEEAEQRRDGLQAQLAQ